MYLCFPLGNALSLQGVLIAIGAFLSPTSVAVYATSRTLGRLGVNTLGAINHVFVFEYAVRTRNPHGFARIALIHAAIEATGAIFFFGLLWLFGTAIYQFWLGGRIAFDRDLFLIVVCQSTLETLWAACTTPLIAWNKHIGIAMTYVVGALVAILAIAGLLYKGYSLEAPALVLTGLFGILSIDAAVRLRNIMHKDSLILHPNENRQFGDAPLDPAPLHRVPAPNRL